MANIRSSMDLQNCRHGDRYPPFISSQFRELLPRQTGKYPYMMGEEGKKAGQGIQTAHPKQQLRKE
jgi:hypothetical protein